MTTFGSKEIRISQLVERISSRGHGSTARAEIMKQMDKVDLLIIDLENLPLTPSFADECIGMLVKSVGLHELRKKIRIINIHPLSKDLIQHVIQRRKSEMNNVA